ncbi:hypothetical protein MMC20_006485 [Loxospora ochrophaea]|nr:hypothetical protein [Loxospora ochrophaea]
MRPLEGKVAIVTGGSRGIGAAIAENLASKGASLVLNYTSASSEQKTADLASALKSKYDVTAIPVQADIGDPAGPAHIVSSAKNHFSHPKTGKFQIDILINNAGLGVNTFLQDITIDEFNRSYAINVLGPLLLMQAAMPYLPNDRSGRIVNVSSVSATCGFESQTVYGGTKAALDAMTRTWSRELSERATVNSVNPGPVATDMFNGAGEPFFAAIKPWAQNAPLMRTRPGIDPEEVLTRGEKMGGRPAYEHEIAGVVGMLCSEESGWCTGSVICANGGFRFSNA